MSNTWKQVQEAKEENRHELLLVGKDLEKALSSTDDSLDSTIFTLVQLNYLRLSSSSLSSIPEDIKHLVNLSNLELQNNKLTYIPKAIGSLSKLKLLDLSDNQIQTLPEEMNNLSSLTSLNLRNNALKEILTFENCTNIGLLDIRLNKISSIKEICHDKLQLLLEIQGGNNEITEIPLEITCLSNLRNLNLASNSIKDVSGDILQCTKLKEINLQGNPLNDKRFKKLVESDRGYSRTVLDYIRQHFKGSQDGSSGSSAKDKKKKTKKREEVNDVDTLCDRLSILSAKEDITVKVTTEVKDIRGYIVCCILRNIDISGTKFKKFLSIQNKLHETICDKRVAATIATHDLSKMRGPLTFCVKSPRGIKILPLNRAKHISALEFFKTLKDEAEVVRKQLKKNTYSGIHKYLYLVEGWEKWPCLVDANGIVISFPPITNADETKISTETVDVFVEVTSSSSFNKAKEVMEALILETLEADLTKEKTENDKRLLTIEQIRVLNEDGTLKMVYPSRTDLLFNSDHKITVIRA